MADQTPADSAAEPQTTAPEAPSAPETTRKLDRRQFIGFA